MSRLKFNEDLFVDNLELQRLSKFIFEDGWEDAIKKNVGSFGVLKNDKLDSNFDNFRITQGSPIGTNPTINISNGHIIAYDSILDSIITVKNKDREPIIFPQDGRWYWVKVSPSTRTLETGKVSVDVAGNLIGSGTLFTEVLRGQPNFPSTIRFYSIDKTDNLTMLPSALNAVEYDVVQVIDDTHAVLAGDFTSESDLYYDVIGSFTPGYVVPSSDKGIFNYSFCTISLVEEVSATGAPTKPAHTKDYDFMIYRIKFESGLMTVQDYRNELFKFKGEFEVEFVENSDIPNIGLVSCSFESDQSTKVNSIAKIEWGFRSTSYSVDVNGEKVTLTQGSGGKFKSTNDFSNGDWDGFRVYVLDSNRNTYDDDYYSSFEKYFKIISSQKSGSSIDLLLEKFSPMDFIPLDYSVASNYKNKDIVNTVSGPYRLVVSSSTGINPIQSSWNNATTYSANQFISYGDSVWISLQNSNIAHQPDINPLYWSRWWKQSKPEILVVPNCEEVLISATIGENITSVTDAFKYASENSFPVIFGSGDINLIGINTSTSTDLIYNLKYKKKNGKVYSSKKVLPSDVIGYIDELGAIVPYSTTFVDNAFIKSIRSASSYVDVKDRIDLGDAQGFQTVNDLAVLATGFAGSIIPINVGEYKKRIIVKAPSPIAGDITFQIGGTNLKGGNEFELQFLDKIVNNPAIAPDPIVIIEAGSSTYNITKDQYRRGNQIVRVRYDSDLSDWNIIHEDNSFNGNNHFESGFAIISTSTSGTTAISSDGNRILILEGDYNSIAVNDDAGNNSIPIAYIEFKNNKPINELHLSTYGGSPVNLILLQDGVDAYESTPSGIPGRYNFHSSPKSNSIDYSTGSLQHELGLGEKAYFVFGNLDNWGGTKQGYKIVSRSLWGIATVPFLQTATIVNLTGTGGIDDTATATINIPYSSVARRLWITTNSNALTFGSTSAQALILRADLYVNGVLKKSSSAQYQGSASQIFGANLTTECFLDVAAGVHSVAIYIKYHWPIAYMASGTLNDNIVTVFGVPTGNCL